MSKLIKLIFASSVLLSSAVYADCPADPETQCPAFGSSLADALNCHYNAKLLVPDDPLAQLVIAGNPIPVGPKFDHGVPVCMYANSSMGQSVPAPLYYIPSNQHH